MSKTYMEYEELSGEGLPEDDFEVFPGKWIRIRSLSRSHMHYLAKLGDEAEKAEQFGLVHGVIQPKMTHDQVNHWAKSCGPGAIGRIVEAILELSDMGETEKETFRPDIGGTGFEIPTDASGEVGADLTRVG